MGRDLSPPWRENPDGSWSFAPDDAPVRLTADTEPDDPWHVDPPDAEVLAESDEWTDYIRAEVADILDRHGLR